MLQQPCKWDLVHSETLLIVYKKPFWITTWRCPNKKKKPKHVPVMIVYLSFICINIIKIVFPVKLYIFYCLLKTQRGCLTWKPGFKLIWKHFPRGIFNPLNPELNPICYLLALLGAHHLLHVSRIRVKSLTLRLLMSYIYGAPILDVFRSYTTTQHSR